jgi:hypothetical protein
MQEARCNCQILRIAECIMLAQGLIFKRPSGAGPRMRLESHGKLCERTHSCCPIPEYQVHIHGSCFHLLYHFLTQADSIFRTAIEEFDGCDHRRLELINALKCLEKMRELNRLGSLLSLLRIDTLIPQFSFFDYDSFQQCASVGIDSVG